MAKTYPRLVKAMQWAACLSEGEANACIRDHKAGFPFSGEAVNHYGGTRAVLERAASARVRHIVLDQQAELDRYLAVREAELLLAI